jgi:hypothetical protein
MKRRHRRNHPERRPRPSLEAIVRDCGCPADELARYVAFARELMLAERRSARQDNSEIRNQRPECRKRDGEPTTDVLSDRGRSGQRRWTQIRGREMSPTPGTANRKLGTARMRPRPFPDYSRRTKSIVAKWFRRGASGHLMWLIGKALLARK